MGSRTVIRRLERLEQISRADGGVSILELLPSGEWELMMGGKRNTYPTEEAGRMAHKEFLQKCKKGTKEPVLIIIDI